MDELTEEQKEEIDAMSLREMLAKWRFAPMGTFQTGEPETEYFIKVMNRKRDEDPEGWTRASKELGHG